jgi:hypothetical protein
MPDPKDFDLDFRPQTYWPEFDDYHAIAAARVKGALRRQAAGRLADQGLYDPLICAENLPEEHRIAAGRIHPMFMGGEYLPDLLPNEVEIARATLKSTTMDVISVRARPTKHRIIYRIVDEYYDENLFNYHLIQKTSIRPLTMRQLITLIDNAQENGGLSSCARFYNYEYGGYAEELYDFATITSYFYPALEVWYDLSNQEWLEANTVVEDWENPDWEDEEDGQQ